MCVVCLCLCVCVCVCVCVYEYMYMCGRTCAYVLEVVSVPSSGGYDGEGWEFARS